MTEPTKTILLVEDEMFYFKPLVTKLESAGFKVILANDGQKGLDAVRKNPIDIILLDVIMPNMDGFVMLSELRKDKNFERIPVIMLSVLAIPANEKIVVKDNYCMYLKKPMLTPDKIVELLNALFETQNSGEGKIELDKKMLSQCKDQVQIIE